MTTNCIKSTIHLMTIQTRRKMSPEATMMLLLSTTETSQLSFSTKIELEKSSKHTPYLVLYKSLMFHYYWNNGYQSPLSFCVMTNVTFVKNPSKLPWTKRSLSRPTDWTRKHIIIQREKTTNILRKNQQMYSKLNSLTYALRTITSRLIQEIEQKHNITILT